MDPNIEKKVLQRRKFYASTIFEKAVSEPTHCDMDPNPSTIGTTNPPPPPPPPMPSNTFNSTVDLRPPSMKSGNNRRNGKPPIDSIVQSEVRAKPIVRPEANELIEAKSKLKRSSRISHELDDVHDSNTRRKDFKESALYKAEASKPLKREIDRRMDKDRRIEPQSPTEDSPSYDDSWIRPRLKSGQRHQSQRLEYSSPVRPRHIRIDSGHSDDDWNAQSRQDFRDDISTLIFNKDPKIARWIRQIVNEESDPEEKEKRSQIDEPRRRSSLKKEQDFDPEIDALRSNLNRQVSETDAQPSKGKSKAMSTKSARSAISTGSRKSLAKSMKSVLFKIDDAQELRSERSSEDLIDVNSNESNKIGHTCEKFTIHGPYVDDELNIFHEICQEYKKAAEMTFAKRTAFSRSKPSHERVYYFLSSDRRSGWFNRKDWTAATNDFKLLDHLFRKILRSKTQRIGEPRLKISHLEKGRTLTTSRFRAIVKSCFNRRNELLKAIVGELKEFENIG
jgi:hypothetical protein